jgi:hypothetical protein
VLRLRGLNVLFGSRIDLCRDFTKSLYIGTFRKIGNPSCHQARPYLSKPATGEGMNKSTLVHTQIQIIIIHFLPSPFPPIPNG